MSSPATRDRPKWPRTEICSTALTFVLTVKNRKNHRQTRPVSGQTCASYCPTARASSRVSGAPQRTLRRRECYQRQAPTATHPLYLEASRLPLVQRRRLRHSVNPPRPDALRYEDLDQNSSSKAHRSKSVSARGRELHPSPKQTVAASPED